MESNWRFNVWERGMWGSDWELAARALFPAFGDMYIVKRTGSPKGWVYFFLLPEDLPTLWASFTITPGLGNFPWGEEVFPD